MKAVAL